MAEPINEKRFAHTGRYGTQIVASRCDLRGGFKVTIPTGLTIEQIVCDMLQIGGWHGVNIWPQIDGFNGYDAVRGSVCNVPAPSTDKLVEALREIAALKNSLDNINLERAQDIARRVLNERGQG